MVVLEEEVDVAIVDDFGTAAVEGIAVHIVRAYAELVAHYVVEAVESEDCIVGEFGYRMVVSVYHLVSLD